MIFTEVTDNKDILGICVEEICDCNKTNSNGFKIPIKVWKKALNSDPCICDGSLSLDEYNHFDYCVDPSDTCIHTLKIDIHEDGKVYATCNLLNTSMGRIVLLFIHDGVEFHLCFYGIATIKDKVVQDDFTLKEIYLSCIPIIYEEDA